MWSPKPPQGPGRPPPAAAAWAISWSCEGAPPETPTAPKQGALRVEQRKPAGEGSQATVAAFQAGGRGSGLAVLPEGLAGELEEHRGAGLGRGHVDRAQHGAVHADEGLEVGAGIEHGDDDRDAESVRPGLAGIGQLPGLLRGEHGCCSWCGCGETFLDSVGSRLGTGEPGRCPPLSVDVPKLRRRARLPVARPRDGPAEPASTRPSRQLHSGTRSPWGSFTVAASTSSGVQVTAARSHAPSRAPSEDPAWRSDARHALPRAAQGLRLRGEPRLDGAALRQPGLDAVHVLSLPFRGCRYDSCPTGWLRSATKPEPSHLHISSGSAFSWGSDALRPYHLQEGADLGRQLPRARQQQHLQRARAYLRKHMYERAVRQPGRGEERRDLWPLTGTSKILCSEGCPLAAVPWRPPASHGWTCA